MIAAPRHRPLSEYALIGNTHTAALVAPDGAIDFACLPHFDSAPVFWRLLDADRGGHFRFGPAGPHEAARRYVDDTAVLETVYTTAGGRCRVLDFLHVQRLDADRIGVDDPVCHRIGRLAEGQAGTVELEVEVRPAFDLGRAPARVDAGDGRARMHAGRDALVLACEGANLRVDPDGVVRGRLALRHGERRWCVLAHTRASEPARAIDVAAADAALAETLAHWRAWTAGITYDGPFRDAVRRSALVLELLTFGPTGAIVASPTTSLPEAIGGARNWDYRYCWVRDAAMVLHALVAVGHHDAARSYFRWMDRVATRHPGDLAVAYTIRGDTVPPEQTIADLAGYRGSRPVRTGNAAAGQLQLDVLGHLGSAIHACATSLGAVTPTMSALATRVADVATARWREPDAGIWEVRGRPTHHLSSRLLCWVAVDRALRLAATGHVHGDVDAWRRARDAIRQDILARGYDPAVASFTQAFGRRTLDASALLVPLVDFLPASDPRVVGTIARVRERLGHGHLVRRYAGDDGVPGRDGAFAACSFWLVQALARAGALDDAHQIFERMLGHASDLGLFAEEIDPATGELLGNYPQGYTHLALIGAATELAAAAARA